MERNHLRTFLEIPYDELEELNLEAKRERIERVDPGNIEEKRRKYLTDEKRIKAVTICFSDLEGRLENRKRALQAMRHVVNGTPVVLGGALVVPAGLMNKLRGDESTDPVAATLVLPSSSVGCRTVSRLPGRI